MRFLLLFLLAVPSTEKESRHRKGVEPDPVVAQRPVELPAVARRPPRSPKRHVRDLSEERARELYRLTRGLAAIIRANVIVERKGELKAGAPIPAEWWSFHSKGIGHVLENPFRFGIVGTVKVVSIQGKREFVGVIQKKDAEFYDWDTSKFSEGEQVELGYAVRFGDDKQIRLSKVPDNIALIAIRLANFEKLKEE